jgi:hypothetical protein
LHVGIRNTVGVLTNDSFTQTNPPIVTATSTLSNATGLDTATLGVLSGSIAFTRPDGGANQIGGPQETGVRVTAIFTKPLGLFINDAVGNAYENTPGPASGKGPYVSGQGTYASSLYETQALIITTAWGAGATVAAGAALTYVTGCALIASRNGYLMPMIDGSDALNSPDNAGGAAEVANGICTGWPAAVATGQSQHSTVIGILKMPNDAVQPELVFDQRI